MTERIQPVEPRGVSRRQALRRVAVAGGTIAWATPVLQTISMPHAFAQTGGPPACRMTGGGHVDDDVFGRVSHGFELHCDLSSPNNLEVNWGKKPEHNFHLQVLTSAGCSDDPSIVPDPPPGTGLDTFTGMGSGTLDGNPGATAQWIFTDAGEPGGNDRMKITILDAGSAVVLDIDHTLGGGNHQMHCNDLTN